MVNMVMQGQIFKNRVRQNNGKIGFMGQVCDSQRQQVTCFLPYLRKVTLTMISLPSIAIETKLVIG